MLRSFREVLAHDPGFDPHGVLTAQIRLPRATYGSEAAQTAAWQAILSGVGSLPGVEAASLDSGLPLADDSMIGEVRTPERAAGTTPEAPRPAARVHAAAPGHFRVLGVPVLRGRAVRPSDTAGAHRVALVSRRAAEALWPGRDPLGRRLWLSIGWDEDDWAEVVGVVGDVQYTGLEADEPAADEGGPQAVGDVYVPYAQLPGVDAAYLLVRTSGDPSAVASGLRERVREVDASLPVFDVMSLGERVERAYSELRFSASCLGAFALAALLLAALGVYGVMAYSVSERTAEMGVRMSLGARPADIARMVLGDGLALTAVGLALGLGAALALGGVLRSQLVGVAPSDPAALAGAAALLLAGALLAAWLPARRAARLDPTEAIRRE
jgi:predicted permease